MHKVFLRWVEGRGRRTRADATDGNMALQLLTGPIIVHYTRFLFSVEASRKAYFPLYFHPRLIWARSDRCDRILAYAKYIPLGTLSS